MKLSREDIEKGRSINGGWSQRQLELLGVKWPLPKGWARSLVGTEVDERQYANFLALKDQHLREKTLSRLADRMLKNPKAATHPQSQSRQLTKAETEQVKNRARMLVATFTNPRTKTGEHTTTCTATTCSHPLCNCT